MPTIELGIDQLELDLENPRISKAADQREAMQRIMDDQAVKLVNLADHIVEAGLNPMDRLLVIRSENTEGRYTVIEGNRRLLALRVLKNPSVLADLDTKPNVRTRLETLAASFDPATVEPMSCFEVADRTEGNSWIDLRHTGENEGRGIVDWQGVARARFKGRDPALQALDLVLQHGKLTDEQRIAVEGRFPISTLDRILSTPDARSKIGFDVKGGKLFTSLPAEEAIKPLRRLVLDLAEKRVNVNDLKRKDEQISYVSGISGVDAPDLSKATGSARAVDEMGDQDFAPVAALLTRRPAAPRATERRSVVPRSARLNVTNAKIAEIYQELRSLDLVKQRNAIAVLLRVFLETSIDHYLTRASIDLTTPKSGGGITDKRLNKRLEEAVADMVSKGANRRDFEGVVRAISVQHHALSIDLLHQYVHNRFVTPLSQDLVAAWDNAQPFFQRIWP